VGAGGEKVGHGNERGPIRGRKPFNEKGKKKYHGAARKGTEEINAFCLKKEAFNSRGRGGVGHRLKKLKAPNLSKPE